MTPGFWDAELDMLNLDDELRSQESCLDPLPGDIPIFMEGNIFDESLHSVSVVSSIEAGTYTDSLVCRATEYIVVPAAWMMCLHDFVCGCAAGVG
jgi:hypothetical protein